MYYNFVDLIKLIKHFNNDRKIEIRAKTRSYIYSACSTPQGIRHSKVKLVPKY